VLDTLLTSTCVSGAAQRSGHSDVMASKHWPIHDFYMSGYVRGMWRWRQVALALGTRLGSASGDQSTVLEVARDVLQEAPSATTRVSSCTSGPHLSESECPGYGLIRTTQSRVTWILRHHTHIVSRGYTGE